jgi:hypothetical protein
MFSESSVKVSGGHCDTLFGDCKVSQYSSVYRTTMTIVKDILSYLPYFIIAGGAIYYFNFRTRGNEDEKKEMVRDSSLESRAVTENPSANSSGDHDIETELLDQLVGADDQTVEELYENLSPELRARLAVQLEDLSDDEFEGDDEDFDRGYDGRNPFLPDNVQGDRDNVIDDNDIAGLTPEQINPRPQAGPSTSRNPNRIVGAKKTKSLARRDRIRAYNEYMRQQGEAERLAQQEFEQQYGDIIALARRDRERREAEADRAIKERQEHKRREDEQQKQKETQIKDKIKRALQSQGKLRLEDQTEVSIAMTVPDATVVSDGSWAVRLTDSNCQQVAESLRVKGRLTAKDLADLLSGL